MFTRLYKLVTLRCSGSRIFFGFLCFFGLGIYVGTHHLNTTLSQWLSFGFANVEVNQKQTSEPKLPIVLFWTQFFESDTAKIFPIYSNCPFQCILTSDRSYVKEADVRVFHARDLSLPLPPDNPTALNVHVNFESPINMGFDDLYRYDYFNVTISYRSTATIFYPYNQAVELDGAETANEIWTSKQVEKAVERKTKKVLVSISNCFWGQSARAEYVDSLSEHIEITRVGRCYGHQVDDKTLKEMINDHYFVLAFENSVCPEYTTEKYWRFKDLIVPVVLSRGVMSSNVVDGTFIAASDFESPVELAAYLDSLIDNPTEYMEYFEWTKKYKRTMMGHESWKHQLSDAGCQLCRLATLKPTHQPVNILSYWNASECIENYGLGLLQQNDQFKQAEAQMADLVRRTGRRRLAHTNQVNYTNMS